MNTSTRYALFALLIAGAIGYFSLDFLPALAWGALLAITLHPLHQFLSNRTKPWVSTSLLTTGLLCLVILPITTLAIKAAQEVPDVRDAIVSFQDKGIEIPSAVTSHELLWSHLSPELMKHGLTTQQTPTHLGMPENVSSSLAPALRASQDTIVKTTLTVSKHTTHMLELSMFTLLSFAVFLANGTLMARQINTLSASIIGENGPAHVKQMTRAMRGTVNGVVLVGLIQGLAISPALAFLHCPHPAVFTVLIIVASLIPFCSPVALAVAVAATFLSAGSTPCFVIAGWGMAVIFAGDHFIKPKFVGHSTELSFLPSMIAILGGLKTLGLIGLFVGPALFSIGATLWKEFTDKTSNPADAIPSTEKN